MSDTQEDSKIPNKLHHSVVEHNVVRFAADKLLPRLRKRKRGEPVWNTWSTGLMSDDELVALTENTLVDLLIIVRRLTKDLPVCDHCHGVGTVIERMGGCRDENDSIICYKCHGAFITKPIP